MSSESQEERIRFLEREQAVTTEVLSRMEDDLKSIAASSQTISDTVTRWKGGIGALLIFGTVAMTIISAIVNYVMGRAGQ